MTSKNVEELIREAKEAGNYDLWKEEIEADLERVKYFRTIGIGVKGYCQLYRGLQPRLG
ncbi:MAG: hypothetical protein P4L49_00385 [Desulfosporosinus sp.]|nr:hypothetical protein [Desulfosporosinus sp.]